MHRFFGISCASLTSCVAVGGNSSEDVTAVSTTDAGVKWKMHVLPAGTKANEGGISCPSTTNCYEANDYVSAVAVSTNGGKTWTDHAVPSSIDLIRGISCPSTTTCFVAGGGGIAATTNGGKKWVAKTLPSGIGDLYGISCAIQRTALPMV